jgi:hypothetical protein
MQHVAVMFQVTVDPDRVLPGTKFIRFGCWSGDTKGAGDELTGWMHLEEWALVHVMGELKDGQLVIGGSDEPAEE